MNRIFLDMDGVLADFGALKESLGLTGDEVKIIPGAYSGLQPIAGAIEGVRSLIGMRPYGVYIASKPATGYPNTYSEKAAWILTHLPELKRSIILTHDKGLLGDADDFLVDDRPHKANCDRFPGTLIHFGSRWCPDWPTLLNYFRGRRLQTVFELHSQKTKADTRFA